MTLGLQQALILPPVPLSALEALIRWSSHPISPNNSTNATVRRAQPFRLTRSHLDAEQLVVCEVRAVSQRARSFT